MLFISQIASSLALIGVFIIGTLAATIHLLKCWPKVSILVSVCAVLEILLNGKMNFYKHAADNYFCPWLMSMPKGLTIGDNFSWICTHLNFAFFSLFLLTYSLAITFFSARATVILTSFALNRGKRLTWTYLLML